MHHATVTTCLILFLCCSSCFAIETGRQNKKKLPNIVLINADDLGYGDVGAYGATKVKTPNIDRLAKEGRRFTDAHSPSAVCSPSRYGLLTGRYPFRKNYWGPISHIQPLTIGTSRQTLANILKKSGYATACVGKWHLGFGNEPIDWNKPLVPGPLQLGFDYYYGIPKVNSGSPFVYVENDRVVGWEANDPLVLGGKSVTKPYPAKSKSHYGGAVKAHQRYVDENIGTVLAEKSVEWIEKQDATNPFFLYLATTQIHHPFTPNDRFKNTSEIGLYGDFIHELDWIVGQVMQALEKKGVTENTLVIFTSDNGGMLNEAGQNAYQMGHQMNGELLGFKFGVWEGGHRVPFIVRWPGRVPADTTSTALVSQIDLLATLAALTEQTIEPGQAEDSLNLLPVWTEDDPEPVRTTLVLHPNKPRFMSLRDGDWVFIPVHGHGGFNGTKLGEHTFAGPSTFGLTQTKHSDFTGIQLNANAPEAQLYNLANDPFQRSNVYSQNPERVAKMKRALDTYRSQIPKGKPIGYICNPKPVSRLKK